jgi:hypothetical protein
MPVEILTKRFGFKIKQIWLAERPYDVTGCSSVRFLDCRERVDLPGFWREEFTTLVVDLRQDLDTLWRNMDAKSVRNRINRTRREGVTVRTSRDFREFYELNRAFREKKGVALESMDVAVTAEHCHLFLSEWKGEVIGGRLYLADEKTMFSRLSASKRLEADKEKAAVIGASNRLMIWEAIQYAKALGLEEYDMGGYYTGPNPDDPRHGINLFKKDFGGTVVTRYNYRRDYSPLFVAASRIGRLLRRARPDTSQS